MPITRDWPMSKREICADGPENITFPPILLEPATSLTCPALIVTEPGDVVAKRGFGLRAHLGQLPLQDVHDAYLGTGRVVVQWSSVKVSPSWLTHDHGA